MKLSRRQFVLQGGALALSFAVPWSCKAATNSGPPSLLAAWQLPTGAYQAGVLTPDFVIEQAVNLPTRPHGLMHLHGHEYLVVARRPGDWLLRLNIQTGGTARLWQEEDRHLNGHSALHGDLLFTTETDVLTGQGLLGVRHSKTFERIDVWPTLGHDPHEMLVLPGGLLGLEEPFLLVANGGIQTHADMGRAQLNPLSMDSSVVAMSPQTGKVLKQWTLPDSRLSLRHMALHPSGVVGIAMQAHHAQKADQGAAPVLALLDESGLRPVVESMDVKGYAGDIAATSEGFVVSCTKNDSVAQFDVKGKLLSTGHAKAACALAAKGNQVWLGHQAGEPGKGLTLDNHWLLV